MEWNDRTVPSCLISLSMMGRMTSSNFQVKMRPTITDKISTSLVECEHVKAKIGKALRADSSHRMWKKLPPARGQKGFLS